VLQSRYFVLIKRLSILLLAYAACRAGFLAFNPGLANGQSAATVLSLFFYGIRFDIFSILAVNTLFILGHILPLPQFYNPRYQKFLKVLFYLFNIPALLMNIVDFIYFRFTQKRTTADFFTSEIAADLRRSSF
jgi:hypothetical protein